jgi:hypothetical protein
VRGWPLAVLLSRACKHEAQTPDVLRELLQGGHRSQLAPIHQGATQQVRGTDVRSVQISRYPVAEAHVALNRGQHERVRGRRSEQVGDVVGMVYAHELLPRSSGCDIAAASTHVPLATRCEHGVVQYDVAERCWGPIGPGEWRNVIELFAVFGGVAATELDSGAECASSDAAEGRVASLSPFFRQAFTLAPQTTSNDLLTRLACGHSVSGKQRIQSIVADDIRWQSVKWKSCRDNVAHAVFVRALINSQLSHAAAVFIRQVWSCVMFVDRFDSVPGFPVSLAAAGFLPSFAVRRA